MDSIEKIVLLCLMGFFGAITPGPDILLTLKTTLRYGILQGFKVLFGIASGWFLYLGIIYVGLSHWLNTPIIQLILSFVGGGYLLYLAFAMLNATPYTLDSTHNVKKDGFLQGLILNVSNPKAILFFIFLVGFCALNVERLLLHYCFNFTRFYNKILGLDLPQPQFCICLFIQTIALSIKVIFHRKAIFYIRNT